MFGIALICFYIASKVFDLFPNHDIIDICEYTAGKKVKNVYSILVLVYLLIISSFVIRIFAESLVLIYFPNIDVEIVILFFIVITTILNLYGFKSITRITLIILPIILVSMIIIFLFSSNDFTPERALPFFGYGIKNTFLTGLRKYFCF